ncbi:helicase [Morganella phage Mecenats66]|nr:helicase [Morganella phage Mecenats66]
MAQILKLRDYQEEAVSGVRLAFQKRYKAVLLILPTGAGKTVCFSDIARSAVAMGNKVMILAHRDQLIKQASEKLDSNGVNHGIIMAGFTPDPSARCQVASVQTLRRRLKSKFFDSFEPTIIIIDEAHLSAASSYLAVFERFSKSLLLGVTGTPCRLDGKPLGKEAGGIYDYMYVGIGIRELIDRGFLARPIVYAPTTRLDLSTLKTSMGDYKQDQAEKMMIDPDITGDAVNHYRQIAYGRPAVAWCVSIRHAELVRDDFRANGIPCETLTGEDSTARRDDVLGRLARKEILVVTFVGLLVEGVDVPEISCIILLRPTKSFSAYRQTCGRGLRVLPNKLDCIILDHAGLTYIHGFIDDDVDWSLTESLGDNQKKSKSAPVARAVSCKKCFSLVRPQPTCPVCGSSLESEMRKLRVDESGVLVEITDEYRKKIEAQRLAEKSKLLRMEVGQAKTFEQLLEIQDRRGYSEGWAKETYNSRLRRIAHQG